MKNFIVKYFFNSPKKAFYTAVVYSGVLVILTFALVVDYITDQSVNVYWVIAGFGVYLLCVFQKYLSDKQEPYYKEKYKTLFNSLKDLPESKFFIADQDVKEEMFLAGELKQEGGKQ